MGASAHRLSTLNLAWPPVLCGHEVVRGFCLGFCVTNGSFRRAEAHAHVGGRFDGFICIAPGIEPSDQLLLHELAHLYTPGGHTRRWRKKFLALAAEHSPEMASLAVLELEECYTSHPRPRATSPLDESVT